MSTLQAMLTQNKVAIYIRVSTLYQVDKASLPFQREDLINYAKYALGIEAFEVFEDAGYSAKNTDRPDYQKMMSRIRTGEFTHLLVWKIDRISRNLIDFATMYDELKRLGVTFVSKNEQFDTSSAMGEAMLKIILVFAELERKMTSERVSAVLLSRANDGIWNGGKIPFGYSYDKTKKEFSFNESEKKIVLHIYDLYEATRSLTMVAKLLNEKGYRPRSGSPWNPMTVRIILTSPFYVGTYRYNYHNESDGYKVNDESEWIMIENHHPAMIEKERQDYIISILKSKQRNSTTPKTYSRVNTHIFAGLLKCGQCGSPMVASVGRPVKSGWIPSTYGCSRRRRFKDCQNKYITDATLSPFVFGFIANMIRAESSIRKTTTIETFEKNLLRGEAFWNVDHIERPGLEQLYTNFRNKLFEQQPFETVTIMQASTEIQEIDVLLADRSKTERALNRLQSLYLYNDDAMSEKDYYTERKRLLDRVSSINERLDKLKKDDALSMQLNLSDDEFRAKAQYFLLTQKLQDPKVENYDKILRKIDHKILKEFAVKTIAQIQSLNGKVSSILFRNKVEIRFSYTPET